MSSLSKLAELYKGSSEEWSQKKEGEFEGGINALEVIFFWSLVVSYNLCLHMRSLELLTKALGIKDLSVKKGKKD